MREKSILMVFVVFCAAVLSGVAFYASSEGFDPLSSLTISGGGKDERHEQTPQPDRSINKVDQQRPKTFKNLAKADIRDFFDLSIPMDQPHMPESYIVSWATLVISDVMSFSHRNYAEHMATADDYFTKDGWESFKTLMERTRMMQTVKDNQYSVVTAPIGGPQLRTTVVSQGIRNWNILVPVIISYQGPRGAQDMKALLNLMIVRSANRKHSYGLAISQLLVTVQK